MKALTPSLPIPINPGLLWTRKEDALSVPMGEVQLYFCPNCGHTINHCYSPDLINYNSWYEKSLHDQSMYQHYQRLEVDRIIERYHIEGKEVMEITTTSGDYSNLFSELGDNQAVVFPPELFENPGRRGQKIRLIYLLTHISTEQMKIHADLICCQNVLSESTIPRLFLRTIHDSINDPQKTSGYFEVQSAIQFLKTMKLWDLRYSQYSLFSIYSIIVLFESCGFDVKLIRETNDGKVISIDVVAITPESGRSSMAARRELDRISDLSAKFEAKIIEEMAYWKNTLERYFEEKKRIVMWGCDERGVVAMNMLRMQEYINMVVDSNFEKIDLFIPGTGFRIHSPAHIQTAKPDVILISNPLHETEIRKMVASMGQDPEYLIL